VISRRTLPNFGNDLSGELFPSDLFSIVGNGATAVRGKPDPARDRTFSGGSGVVRINTSVTRAENQAGSSRRMRRATPRSLATPAANQPSTSSLAMTAPWATRNGTRVRSHRASLRASANASTNER
jgi:hypothetical protein